MSVDKQENKEHFIQTASSSQTSEFLFYLSLLFGLWLSTHEMISFLTAKMKEHTNFTSDVDARSCFNSSDDALPF